MQPMYISILMVETGQNIRRLMNVQGYSVKDVQNVMGFENPQAVYKWLAGKSLPNTDNLVVLSRLLKTAIEDILVIDEGIAA